LPSRQLQKVKDRLMSKFYTAEHRALQDKFDTRRVAEMMENRMRTANSPNRCVRSSNLWTCSFFRPSTHLAGRLVLTRAVRPDLPQAQQRLAFQAEMTPSQLEELNWDWEFWARPNQVMPKGDWLTWLLLAGRGFDKTRSAAEAVRALAIGATPLAAGNMPGLPWSPRRQRTLGA
jgi:hypothetical protein